MKSEILLWEILVPTVTRKGEKPIRTRFHRVWDRKVREISGGLTIMTPAKGQWISADGVLFVERMIPVRFLATKEQMNKIVDMTIIYYDQLAVLCYAVGFNIVMRTLEEVKK
jgi:hypothetical protein